MSDTRVRTAIVGCGRYTKFLLPSILTQRDTTEIVAFSDPAEQAYLSVQPFFEELGLPLPPNEPEFDRLLARYAGELDAAFILTPHASHFPQAKACLEAGLDVLLQKPMVISAAEAQGLIEARDRTGNLLVVAFPGSLSPQIRRAAKMLRSGECGSILTMAAVVYEDWRSVNTGTWRQIPAISGGGFFFDAGAHMLNTICDLAGEDFVEVAAWLDTRGAPVDISGVVMGRLASGALVTLNGSGETTTPPSSDIRVVCTGGTLHTNIWGTTLGWQQKGQRLPDAIDVSPSMGVWQQFLAVRNGLIENPCPPEVGLRMARLWDAIRASSAQGGAVVSV